MRFCVLKIPLNRLRQIGRVKSFFATALLKVTLQCEQSFLTLCKYFIESPFPQCYNFNIQCCEIYNYNTKSGAGMRINRNINQYFDRMGPDDVCLLWSSMLDLKTRINSMEYLLGGKCDRSLEHIE